MPRKPVPVLTEFDLLVMLAVLRLGDAAYPLAIGDAIETKMGRRAARGAVLITLERLEHKGLLTSWYGDPTPVRGARGGRDADRPYVGGDQRAGCAVDIVNLKTTYQFDRHFLVRLIEQFEGVDVSRASYIYGALAAAYSLMQFLFAPLLGVLSDRYGDPDL